MFRCLQLTNWFPHNLCNEIGSDEFVYIASLLLKHIQVLKGAYWINSNSSFNIGLLSIAPPLVIALPTLQ